MSANLYSAPLDSITADDVLAFLDENRPEGPLLDYKEENPASPGIPETAIDTITAFANTYGGLLILGVDSDEHTNRPTAHNGLTLAKKKLEEALMSRCFSSTVPPVVPEVRVCPFKSNPALAADDRAFVVVRVSPSLGTVHAIQGNQVKVRVGSQSRLADVPTLRLLFERERNRESVVTKWGDDMVQQAIALRALFAGEAKQPRWAPGSQRIYFELLPIDAANELLPFGEHSAGIGSLDHHLVMEIGAAGWATIDDGRIPMPNGLGMLTAFLGRRSMTREERNAGPVTLMYFDRSGALLADMPTASLGSVQPGPVGLDTHEFS